MMMRALFTQKHNPVPAPKSPCKFAEPQNDKNKRILPRNSLAQHWARDWRALALIKERIKQRKKAQRALSQRYTRNLTPSRVGAWRDTVRAVTLRVHDVDARLSKVHKHELPAAASNALSPQATH